MVGAVSLKPSRWYKFTYTVSSPATSPAATITTAVASIATSLTLTAAAQTTYFKSAAAPGTFTINATAGVFTLDGLSLQEITGGDLIIGGQVYASGLNTTGGLLPIIAGTGNIGSATFPVADIYLAGTSGTPGTNNFKFTGASTGGLRTITLPDNSVTVNAAADISGTTLASNVVTSSLTAVGTLATGVWNAGAVTTSDNKVVVTGTQSPASNAAGTAGSIAWDASYIYICTASGAWKRAALTGGY